MRLIHQIHQDQHDYNDKNNKRMSGMIDQMTTLTVCVDGLQEYIHHVGMPHHYLGNGVHGRARGRGHQ